jgi:death-on-curing family protein
MLKFLSLKDCLNEIFPTIRVSLAAEDNPAPRYEDEANGLEKLAAVFSLVKNSAYYKGFFPKAAYLFLAILQGHFFSNGNKRLALLSVVRFYEINGYQEFSFSRKKYLEKLKEIFPKAKLRKTSEIKAVFPEMLYHLTKIVADKKSRGEGNFDSLKSKVEEFLRFSLSNQK